jgi:hypothetical protein
MGGVQDLRQSVQARESGRETLEQKWGCAAEEVDCSPSNHTALGCSRSHTASRQWQKGGALGNVPRRRPVAGEESGTAIALALLRVRALVHSGCGALSIHVCGFCLMAQPAGATAKYTG